MHGITKTIYDYSKIDKKVDNIVKNVASYIDYFDIDYIKEEIFRAYIYARDAHEWQFRLSWSPYIIHPVEATEILLSLKPDLSTIQACLLHDVVEDTPRTLDDILKVFWKDVSFLCSWMEKLWKVRYVWEDRNIWSLRKMFIAMAEDLRVIFIKLSDRLHNMKTLKFHPKKEKRERIAMETLNIYAPIADRLWLYNFKNSLEEECFKILDFTSYNKLKKELKEMEQSRKYFEENAKTEIAKILWDKVENYEVDFRVKSIYSIHKKMIKKWIESSKDLYDLFWARIIVKTISDCYKVLWIIHNNWTPIPNKFKDYIALPKPNWYKSLHTSVLWLLAKQPIEIQIKTYEMKEYSDIWVAAHFDYKEKWSTISQDVYWVNELKELTESLENNDFMTSLKIDVFKNRIFVFTPKWESINLPVWSTPIDFAYYVHTDLWNHITLAKVNWIVSPLDKELRNWDRIDVIIDKSKFPSPYRLSFVKTAKAKNKIKAFLKKDNEDLYRERGKSIMNNYLLKANFPEFDKEFSILKTLDWRTYNLEERWKLIEQIWDFSITPATLLKKIIKSNKIHIYKWPKKINEDTHIDLKENNDKIDIVIWGEEWMPYKLCYCCRRKIPKNIVAHINSKWIISIHRADCKILEGVNKDRLLPAYIKWDKDNILSINLRFILKNEIWVFKELSEIIYSMKINIEEIVSKRINFDKTEVFFRLEIPDYDYLIIERLIDRVKFDLWQKLIEYNIDRLE